MVMKSASGGSIFASHFSFGFVDVRYNTSYAIKGGSVLFAPARIVGCNGYIKESQTS